METDGAVLKRKEDTFIDYAIKRIKSDNGFCASLRRADNPDTEYQAWENLVAWCDIEKTWERLPFCIVSAALAKAKPDKDGHMGIGQALTACYEDGYESEPARARLRRLLSCDSVEEVCRILRSMLSIIQSRGVPISYGRLLFELLHFGDGHHLKPRWAADFYRRRDKE